MKASVTGRCNISLVCAGKAEQLPWGIRFMVADEGDAFKIAYLYRNSPHGVQVRWCEPVQKFSVTVFNEFAELNGIDRS